MSIPITPTQAHTGLSQDLRNNIYSALLSGPGIRNIESTLDQQLRQSGFKDNLRAYITELFRSGQATTCEEARELAMAKIREQMGGGGGAANGVINGNGEVGENGAGGVVVPDLKIPKSAIDAGAKTVMKELERVCEITYEDGEK
ncbi:hypothetical protein BDW02DRAFT_568826 [Decorospora gaudefroyi]|uniref:Uncharacterized protein n=1 Tax=Decorospora gaudefroyi TaxID=184978 RepID=A0A6A5KEU4_9PLEO|nr:hypothetical protein BDW02DRAFT_568826 [Decorospora gaudefroyi]